MTESCSQTAAEQDGMATSCSCQEQGEQTGAPVMESQEQQRPNGATCSKCKLRPAQVAIHLLAALRRAQNTELMVTLIRRPLQDSGSCSVDSASANMSGSRFAALPELMVSSSVETLW